MPIQTGILPAGSTLTVDYSIGETATISYQDGDIGVVDNGQTKTTDRTIGPFANDVAYSIDYTGWPKVFTTAAGGAITTISLPLPDPASLPVGATVSATGATLTTEGAKFGVTKITTKMTRLFVSGDSISCVTPYGTGLLAGEPYAARLKTYFEAKGITFVNPAQPDQCINGYWRSSMMDTPLVASDTFIGMHGFNCPRNIGVSADQLTDIGMAYEAYLAWCAVPESAKVRVKTIGTTTDNPDVVSSANWNNFPTFVSGTGSAYSQTAGSTKTFTVTGDTLYVWYMRKSGVTGQLGITIDGVDHGAVSTDMSYVPYSTFDWEPAVMRITGLTSGQHTVVITALVTGQAQPLIGVAGFYANLVNGPRVISALPIKMSAAGYATTVKNDPAQVSATFSQTWEPQWMYGSGGTQRLHTVMRGVVPALQNDGLNIKLIDFSKIIDVRTDITADVIHPNKQGHLKLFNFARNEVEGKFS